MELGGKLFFGGSGPLVGRVDTKFTLPPPSSRLTSFLSIMPWIILCAAQEEQNFITFITHEIWTHYA